MIDDSNINASIYRALKYNRKKCRWLKIFGYSLKDLKSHLEKQFDEKMSWENYGSYWRIDKIIPFSAYKSLEFKKCWSLKNLRPLEKKECFKKKRNKILEKLIKQYNLYDILPLGTLEFD